MGKVVASMFVSLDGVMEDPGGSEDAGHGAWTFPYWNDEIGKVKLGELVAADALLLGRVTYEGFAAAWPERSDEEGFAEKFNTMPKHVASTTLTGELAWHNSTVLGADVP